MRIWLGPAFVALFTSAACTPDAPAKNAGSAIGENFPAFQSRFMQALDDSSADAADVARAMEKELSAAMDSVIKSHEDGALRTDPERERAGLVMIYGALYLLRDVQGVMDGKLDQAKVFADRRYGPADGSLLDSQIAFAEGTARRHIAVELLTRAQTLRPKDGRIASWISAATALASLLPNGDLSDENKVKVLAAVDAEPAFNLWTAFIALRDEPIESRRAQDLFDKTKAFIESKRCQDIVPGSSDARNCRSGPLAPFNSQAAVVMLADQYARRGEEALRQHDVPNGMQLVGTAKGILATLQNERLRDATAKWRNAPFLEERLKRLDALKPGAPVPDASFWKSDAYEKVYGCASCHVK